jgi:iron only hydrogenase large subunit-like protein
LGKKEILCVDGIKKVMAFLDNPSPEVKFLDCNFCVGGCIGGPMINSKVSLWRRKRKVSNYLKKSKKEDIPDFKKGLVNKAKGLIFRRSFRRS